MESFYWIVANLPAFVLRKKNEFLFYFVIFDPTATPFNIFITNI